MAQIALRKLANGASEDGILRECSPTLSQAHRQLTVLQVLAEQEQDLVAADNKADTLKGCWASCYRLHAIQATLAHLARRDI